jgi:hypothetical protein
LEHIAYLGAGEFYLEYGDIEYNITAPANLIVAGSVSCKTHRLFNCRSDQSLEPAKNSDKTVMIRSDKEVNDKNSRPNKASCTWKFKFKMQGMLRGGFKGICMGCSKNEFTKWKKSCCGECVSSRKH